ncbi:MAG: hypothetical protein ACP6IQ_05255 [Candidatus Njordarchaeia archaeon]|nr:hypothetical protein [Candidatus Korarchaeota archaeon]
MYKELRELTSNRFRVRIWAIMNRHLTAWIGGSLLASLRNLQKLWITSEKYRKEGPDVFEKFP